MSDGAEPARVALVPRPPDRAERALWILIGVSLAMHVLVFLPSLLGRQAAAAKPPAEIPVEIVQLPPEKPPAKKATEKKAAEQKPEGKKADKPPKPAEKPPADAKKTEPAKSPEKPVAKREPPKPPSPKPEPPKPAPQKPVEQARKPVEPKPSPQQVATQERMEKLLGSMPAIALPSASPVGTDNVGYDRLVLSQVAKAKKEGRYPGIPGHATVAFTLGDKGEVATIEIKRPSGDPALDAEAVAMIHRGEPYPPPPPGGRRDYVITLSFQAT